MTRAALHQLLSTSLPTLRFLVTSLPSSCPRPHFVILCRRRSPVVECTSSFVSRLVHCQLKQRARKEQTHLVLNGIVAASGGHILRHVGLIVWVREFCVPLARSLAPRSIGFSLRSNNQSPAMSTVLDRSVGVVEGTGVGRSSEEESGTSDVETLRCDGRNQLELQLAASPVEVVPPAAAAAGEGVSEPGAPLGGGGCLVV